mmetsp:Transcript_15039/g.28221  ORF Transcript_15039/g.28221 Transcript_15039/m.28221 type:complete len:332 (+) Transcript_15039:1279-2274(+)
MVLVEHVGRPGLHLGLQDSEPNRLRLQRLSAFALHLQPCVHGLELLAPDIHEALARALIEGLVGAEQSPVRVVLHSLHEEVRDPQPIKEVPRTLLFLAVVLPELQEVQYVRVPGLQVHGKGPLPLAAPLVHIARSLVEVPQHGHEAVGVAVGAADVGPPGPDVGDRHADAACGLGDQRALLQGVVDALDAVVLHLQQKARGHLGGRRPGVEERGRGVREELPGHQVIGLQRCRKVPSMNAAGSPHDQVLRTLNDLPMHPQQVGLLQGLEAEIVVAQIPLVVHSRIQLLCIRLHELPNVLGQQGSGAALLVRVLVQHLARLIEGVRGVLVKV